MAVLQDISALTKLQAELEALRAENRKLKTKGSSLKVTEKGGVSLYGMGRFPVTLYYSQWIRLLDMAEGIRSFLEANKASLAIKED